MQKLTLKFILLFSKLWANMGIDVTQLKIIIETKLIIDDRRPLASFTKIKTRNHPNIQRGFNFSFSSLWG